MNTRTESETEFVKLLDQWQKDHVDRNYDPVPILTQCSKILETELTEFHKGDPDPFDDRHPKYIQPESAYGKILVSLEGRTHFTEKLTSTYLRTNSDPKNVGPTAVAAARLLLAAAEGLHISKIVGEDEWLPKTLSSWIMDAGEPLRTYAAGLLVGVDMQKYTDRNRTLISVLLKRLWNYVEPGKYQEEQCITSIQEVKNGAVTHSQKRKLSSTEVNGPNPKKVLLEKPHAQQSSIPPSITPVADLSITDNIYDNDLSNSSWAEQMPAILGCHYSLEPPLSASLCQRYIFDFLKCFGEYQDYLSIFLKLHVLDLITKYLTKKNTDSHLTFKVLEFLGSLLCHNKVAMDFIELNGIQNILSIPRPSMGSTGVSLCLYYLAYKKEAMERACQLSAQVLTEMVKYAIWLLECSHESGRSQAALFFSVTLSFKAVLSLFDRMNGLRCLVNMISTARPIVQSSDDDYDPLDDVNLPYTKQMIKTVCVTLKKYFEAHLTVKVSQMVKAVPALKQKYIALETVSKYKPMICTRDEFLEYLEILREIPDESSARTLDCWPPVASFLRLDGLSLLLKVICMAADWDIYAGQLEATRAALDALCVVTLSRSSQMVLCKKHKNRGIDRVGISVILDQANADDNNDGASQISAIAVIANCTSGICIGESDNDSMKLSSTSTPRQRKKKKGKDAMCKLIQQDDGIKLLLLLLKTTEPAQTADETRYLACKALIGLSDYKPVRQILSKLPLFVNGQLHAILEEPVIKNKKQAHSKLRQSMEILFKKVTGKPITLDLDLNAVRRTHIVAETHVQYNNKDVLLMIHNHLIWSRLNGVADVLAQEAGLFPDHVVMEDKLSTPKQRKFTFPRIRSDDVFDGSGDPSSKHSRISFSRGNRASAKTPTSSSVISIRTPSSQKRSLRGDMTPLYRTSKGQERYKLSRNGIVSVEPRPSDRSPSPTTLNSIIVENFKHQHSKCRNPVVTVPQFSVFSPHHCPEPRNKFGASTNYSTRLYYRRGICPKWGGVGGESSDLRLIYSRFKPGCVIKSNEDHKAPFTSVAFLPNSDSRVVLGDSAGNIQIPGLYSDADHLIQGVSNSDIIHLEPSRKGDVMLTVSSSYWSSNCSLLTLNDLLEQKLTFDADFIEFAKVVQDKVLGTRDSKAVVYDAITGATVSTYEKNELACNYKNNCATFSYDDKLILSDGLLWDVRKSHSSPIHKFDKFNHTISGVFHPNGLHVIINSEIWDLRNYNLLQTVPAFDQCCIQFNSTGSVIYATKMGADESDGDRPCKGLVPAFQTFDSSNYNQLAFVSVRQQVYSLALDRWDRNIAIIEASGHDEVAMSVCRLYDVGLIRDDEEDEEVDSNYDTESSGDDDDDDSSGNGDDRPLDWDDLLAGDDHSSSWEDSSVELGNASSFDLNDELNATSSSGSFNDESEWETLDED